MDYLINTTYITKLLKKCDQPYLIELKNKMYGNNLERKRKKKNQTDISKLMPFLGNISPYNSKFFFCPTIPWAMELPARAIIMGNTSQSDKGVRASWRPALAPEGARLFSLEEQPLAIVKISRGFN